MEACTHVLLLLYFYCTWAVLLLYLGYFYCTYSFVLCLPYDRARQRRPHSVMPTMPPGRWRRDAVLPVRMPFRSYCMRRHCRASYPNTTSASSSAATSATSASRSNRAFTDHSTETQHTYSNKQCLHRPQHWNTIHRLKQTAPSQTTALKYNTQTKTNCAFTDHSTETQHTDSTNHAFTDHSTETQHTDSNTALKHNTQTQTQHWNTTHRLKH